MWADRPRSYFLTENFLHVLDRTVHLSRVARTLSKLAYHGAGEQVPQQLSMRYELRDEQSIRPVQRTVNAVVLTLTQTVTKRSLPNLADQVTGCLRSGRRIEILLSSELGLIVGFDSQQTIVDLMLVRRLSVSRCECGLVSGVADAAVNVGSAVKGVLG